MKICFPYSSVKLLTAASRISQCILPAHAPQLCSRLLNRVVPCWLADEGEDAVADEAMHDINAREDALSEEPSSSSDPDSDDNADDSAQARASAMVQGVGWGDEEEPEPPPPPLAGDCPLLQYMRVHMCTSARFTP